MAEWESPDHWSMDEQAMWEDFVSIDPRLGEDDYAMILYHESYFDLDILTPDRDQWHDDLEQYLMDEYGIDFDEVFDWEAYDEWYESA